MKNNAYTDKLSDVTIVIPTKDRSYYVDRLLSYYTNLDFIGVILIIDSSNKKESDRIRQRIERINKRNYIYTHSEGLPTMVIKENLNLIKTKYVSFLGDDDYIIPNAILKSILFLEKNLDIVGCRGDGIIVQGSDISSKPIKMYGRVDRKESMSGDRLINFFSNYTTPFFHVCRSNIFKNGYLLAPSMSKISQGYDRLIGDELIVSAAMLAQGKFATIDGLHLIRTDNIERIELRNSWYHEKSDLCKKGRCVAIDDFTKKISTIVSERDSITFLEAEKIVTKIHQTNVFSKEYNSKLIVYIKILVKPLMLYLGLWKFILFFRYNIRAIKILAHKNLFRGKNNYLDLDDLLDPNNHNYKDFMPVYTSLTTPLVKKDS